MTTIFGIPANVVYATAGVYALLIVASAIVWMLSRRDEAGHYRELKDRVRSWWWMIGAFTLAMLSSRTVAIVFLAFISYLALKEYLSLIPTRRIDRGVLLFAYLAIPLQFYWAAIDWYGMFIVSRRDRAASPRRSPPSRRASATSPRRGRKCRWSRSSCMGSARPCPKARHCSCRSIAW